MEEKNWLLMARACIHEDHLGKNLKYLHHNIISHIDSYKKDHYYIFLIIAVVVTEIETEPEKGYSITRKNSVSFLSIFLDGDQ